VRANESMQRPALRAAADRERGADICRWDRRSAEAIPQAHTNRSVQSLWAEFDAACDYTPLTKLKESQEMFAEFDAVSF